MISLSILSNCYRVGEEPNTLYFNPTQYIYIYTHVYTYIYICAYTYIQTYMHACTYLMVFRCIKSYYEAPVIQGVYRKMFIGIRVQGI